MTKQEINEKWEDALSILKAETSKVSYDTWFHPLTVSYLEEDTIYLATVDELSKNALIPRFSKLLENTISQAFGRSYNVIIEVSHTEENTIKQVNENIAHKLNLNPKYTFDTFINGASNSLAFAASRAVAEEPANKYNPLFIYGGVGLGKTHLMHAIGNYVAQNKADQKILYVSIEKFTSDFISSIQSNKGDEFRKKYREIDVLLIDDIQFVKGKERTQEEFFHTFNELFENNKQIIICSDRPPAEIEQLENRLRSRFEWGLIVDVQEPDFETRVAILRQKITFNKQENRFSDEVISFLANAITSNVRQLEGSINKVSAFADLKGGPITVDVARDAIKNELSHKPTVLSISYIQEIVAEYYRLSIEDFKTKKRNQSIAFPRQIAMYLARTLTDTSLPKIGEQFGGRDHTTVLHAIEKITEKIAEDPSFKKDVIDHLENKLKLN